MKKQYYFTMLLTVWMLIIAPRSEAVQLSGIYSIDVSLPATGSNFKDLQSAVVYLTGSGTRPDGGPSNTLPFGISGNVKFNIAAGTYSLTSTLSIDSIPGANELNRIEFDGVNAASCILSGSVANNPLIRLHYCRYVTLKNLTVTNLSNNSCAGISVQGNTSDDGGTGCAIQYCIVNLPNVGSANSAGISVTDNMNGYSMSSHMANKVVIENNMINGGYYGILDIGIGVNAYNFDHRVRGNTVNNSFYCGIYLGWLYNACTIENNTINASASGHINGYGIFMDNCTNSNTSASHIISGNRTKNTGQYGIFLLNADGSSDYPTQIYNNMIGAGFRNNISGSNGLVIQGSGNSYTEVYYNSVNCDIPYTTPGTSAPVFYFSGSSNLICKNNIFAYSATTGYGIPAYIAENPSNSAVNYNLYINKSNKDIIYRGGVLYDESSYKFSLTGGDSSGIELSLNDFVAPTDLHMNSSICAKGVAVSYITTDIDGDTRGSVPEIGCDELGLTYSTNISMLSLVSPAGVFNGSQTVKATFRNIGTNTVSNALFWLKINSTVVTSQAYSGSLASCAGDTITFSVPFDFLPGNSYQVVVYSENPNGVPDQFKANDTLSVTLKAALSAGMYTIDPSGSGATNFLTINAAIDALKGGITGPVVFNVASGTYTVNSTIEIPSIVGTNTINTVTFDGGDSATCIFSGNILNNPVVRLSNASFVHLRNFKIINTNASGCSGVALVGNNRDNAGSNCSVKRCQIELPNVGQNYSVVLGITQEATGMAPIAGMGCDSIEIDSNTLIGGTNGIFIYGRWWSNSANKGFSIRNNSILNSVNKGIEVQFISERVLVSYNKIFMSDDSDPSSRGIDLKADPSASGTTHIVLSNIVHGAGTYGIFINGTAGNTANPLQVYNNMVTGKFKSGGAALYLNFGSATSAGCGEIYHNTLSYELDNSSLQSAAFYYNGNPNNLKCRNNIFMVSGAQSSAVAMRIEGQPNRTFNQNLYYNKSGKYLVNTNRGKYYFSKYNYKVAAAGGDSSFHDMNLGDFTDGNDLHYTSACGGLKGINLLSAVPLDIDGQVRSAIPDIGCDEGSGGLPQDISLVEMIHPKGLVNGVQNVKIKFRNLSATQVTMADFILKVNNIIVDSQRYSGALLPCGEDSITFANAVNFMQGSLYSVSVYVSNPNGSIDSHLSNDTLTASLSGAMSGGVYTIDPGGSGSNNFISFEAAANALKTGITGPVLFNVMPATYSLTATLDIFKVPGASAVNTVEFDGGTGNAATRILTGAVSSLPLVRLNECNYVKLKNLTIKNTFTGDCSGVLILGNQFDNSGTGCSITNCIVELPNVNMDDRSGSIVISGFMDGFSFSSYRQRADSISIDSNVLIGANQAISISGGNDSLFNRAFNIRGNHFSKVYVHGIQSSEVINGIEINNNIIMMDENGSASGRGIYVSAGSQVNNRSSYLIANNKIVNAGYHGISIQNLRTGPLAPTKVYNNMISGIFRNPSAPNAIYVSENAASYTEIIHNSIHFSKEDVTAQNAGIINILSGQNLVCKNNIVFYDAKMGNAYPLYINTNVRQDSVDYNNYFNRANDNLVYRSGSSYNRGNFNTSLAGGLHSVNELPDFVSGNDLHLLHSCGSKGANLGSKVPLDIDGQARGVNPAIGADEVTSLSNDISVTSFISPVTPASGTQLVGVKFRNVGLNPLSSGQFTLVVNGLIHSTFAYAGGIASCSFDSISFPNPVSFNRGDSVNIRVYSSAPNGALDDMPVNDTLETVFYGAFAPGLYTINPAGSGSNNFVSFTDACNVLNKVGISGTVVFDVSPAVYAEQVSLINVPGTSAGSTITFNGLSRDNCIVQYSQLGTTNAHTFLIRNTPYVTIRNLTIRNLGITNGAALHLRGQSHFTKVKNCNIFNTAPVTSENESSTVTGILMNGQESDYFSGAKIDNCEIDSNHIRYGWSGIRLSAEVNSRNNKFRYNRIDTTVYGIRLEGSVDGMDVSHNIITNPVDHFVFKQVYATTVPIYASLSSNGFGDSNYASIMSNKIVGYGQAGIYLTDAKNIDDNDFSKIKVRSIVANNMISGANNAGNGAWGMTMVSNVGLDVFHNTVLMDGEVTGQGGAYAEIYAYGTDIRNNNFVCLTDGYPLLIRYPAEPMPNIDYNNYLNYNGSTLALIYDTIYTSANLTTASGSFNQHAFGADVKFVSTNNDLHLRSVNCQVFKGDSAGYIRLRVDSSDFDGEIRAIHPVVGADELMLVTTDIGIDSVLSPTMPYSGTTSIKVRLKNYGSTVLTSATIKCQVNGGSPQTFAYTGGLASCSSDEIVFPGSFNFLPGFGYQIKAWTENPNGVIDSSAFNDSVTTSFCAAMSGIYTIDSSGTGPANFASIRAAIQSLNCAGVSGPVEFHIANGTYAEQMQLFDFKGASSSNTVTFRSASGNRDSVILLFNGSYAGGTFDPSVQSIIELMASYVKIKDITLEIAGNMPMCAIGNTGVTDHPFPEQIDHPKIWRKVVNLIGEV